MQSMKDRFEELVEGASNDVDALDGRFGDENAAGKNRAHINITDRYLSTAVREMARRIDELEAQVSKLTRGER